MNGQTSAGAGRFERNATGELRYVPVPPAPGPRPDATDLRVHSHRHANLPDWQRSVLAISAWILDTAAHLGIGILAYAAFYSTPDTRHAAAVAAIAAWLAASFVHRVLIQHTTHATAGKALLGLHLENPDHQSITHWQLTKLWLMPAAFAPLLSW